MKSRYGLAGILGTFVLVALATPAFALKTAPSVSKPKTQVVALKKTKAIKKISLKSGSKTVIGCGKK